MSKVRVLNCLGALNTGGAETLVMNILRNIDRDKYQFDFLLFDQTPAFYDDEVKSLGSNLYYLQSLKKAGVLQYIKNIEVFLKENKVDVIHSHMDWQGGFIALAAKRANVKKIIVHSHANQDMFKHNFVYKMMIELNKMLISKCATNQIACSKEAGESLFKSNFEILINGVDFEKFQNPNKEKVNELIREFDIHENDIVLGHVGGFSENKNQEFIIDVFSELVKSNDNYKLILVGTGSTKEQLIQKVSELELNNKVYFAGVRSEIPELMNIFDLFLFPSIYEGLGIVAIEAQASHTYCISSDSIPRSVDTKANLIEFQPLDQQIWIERIKQYNKQKKSTNQIVDSEYDINKTCKKLEKIYS